MSGRKAIPRLMLLSGLLLLSYEGAGQTRNPREPAVIKVQAPSVVVDVLVTDKKGRHVDGLKASDFVIYEDDVRQRISTFVPPALSGRAQPEGAKAAASVSAAPAATAKPEPVTLANVRFITLVLDLGDLQGGSIDRAIRAAQRYLETTIAPEDFVAVYWIDQSLHLAVPFTADKNAAATALKNIGRRALAGQFSSAARKETQDEIDQLNEQVYGLVPSSTMGMSDQAGATSGGGQGGVSGGPAAAAFQMGLREIATLRQFLWSQGTFQARAVFVALRAMAQSYASLPGRKNVVVFSQGFLHSPEAKPQMAAVIDSANRANVAFYIVDASGLSSSYDAESDLPPDTGGMRESYIMAQWSPSDVIAYGLDKFDWNEHVGFENQYDDLGQVASATGGLFIRNQNDLLNGLKLADSDLREFYTLVYQPTNTRYDGSFRRIRVGLAESGYHLRFRQGYWAIPPGEETTMTPAAAQLLSAYRNGSLNSGLTPEMNAALLLAPDGKFAVPVHLAFPGKLLRFDKVNDSYVAALSLVLAAESSDGRLISVHQRFLNLKFGKKEWDAFQKKSLDIDARLSMPELEPVKLVAILQLTGGTLAIGREELTVEAGAGGLGVTGVALSNDIEPAPSSADPSDPLRGENFQFFLPARADFSARDKLTVLFGIVQNGAEAGRVPKPLKVTYAIRGGDRQTKRFPSEEVRPSHARFVVLKQFDLAGLTPGQYSLEIQVVDADGAEANRRAGFGIQ